LQGWQRSNQAQWFSFRASSTRNPSLQGFQPILLLGARRFAKLDIRIRVNGGGYTSQIYAIRQALAKAIVAYNQKFVDESTKQEIKSLLLQYDRTLLVADPRYREPKKFGGRSATAAGVGSLLGGFVGFLLRPSFPLVGQLPLMVVITRGADLEGAGRLFLPTAEASFNCVVIGAVIGAVVLGIVSSLSRNS